MIIKTPKMARYFYFLLMAKLVTARTKYLIAPERFS